jgi:GDPmannose 4,6-dehydratase
MEDLMTRDKTAIITGVTGQDGSYLAEFLLDKGYNVVGIARRCSTSNTRNLSVVNNYPNFKLVTGDITDLSSLIRIFKAVQPGEIYNLAAQSHVKVSFDEPFHTLRATGEGAVNVMEAMRLACPKSKLYQASSSEQFGGSHGRLAEDGISYLQDESTPFSPRSPYGCAKTYAHNMARMYRESYGLFICLGILFNHESQRRGEAFVTRKISKLVSQVYWARRGGRSIQRMPFGNLSAYRDFGHAKDYVRAMYMMLNRSSPDDFVIATGNTLPISKFMEDAFACINVRNYLDYLYIDSNLFRPSEVDYLRGNSSKAKSLLNWEPNISYIQLVQLMVEGDMYGT